MQNAISNRFGMLLLADLFFGATQIGLFILAYRTNVEGLTISLAAIALLLTVLIFWLIFTTHEHRGFRIINGVLLGLYVLLFVVSSIAMD